MRVNFGAAGQSQAKVPMSDEINFLTSLDTYRLSFHYLQI